MPNGRKTQRLVLILFLPKVDGQGRVSPRDEEGYKRSSLARGRWVLQSDRVATRVTMGITVPDHRRYGLCE